MEAELINYFEENKVKKNKYGGYDFKVEDINFSVIDMPLGLSMQYSYVSKRTAIEPTEIILNSKTSLQEFCAKIVEVVEKIKK